MWLASSLLVACGGGEPAWERPNVILIVVDTLRSDRLSHAGYRRPTAVGLDEFAAESTFFPNAYAPSSWTRPSVASVLTGLFTAHHGVNWYTRLGEDAVTLAEVLQRHGWQTSGHSVNHNVTREVGLAQGFDHFDDSISAPEPGSDIRALLKRVTIGLHASPESPIFLYLHPMNVHGPYPVPRARRRDLLGRMPRAGFVLYRGPMAEIMVEHRLEARDQVTPAYLQSLDETYDTAVRYTFDELGAFMDLLRQRGLYDDSLIIVTSDHGEELFEHGGFSHAYSLYDEVLRVPLYVKRPHQQRGSVVHDRVSLMDIFPTVLDLLEIEPPLAVDGRSLVPMLEGGVSDESAEGSGTDPQLYEVRWHDRCVARSIRSGSHKLIEIESNYEGLEKVSQLFDVSRDPGETRDLSGEAPELVVQLREAMQRGFEAHEARRMSASELRLDEADREKLRALGYIH